MLKYMEFSTFPLTGSKDIAETKVPDIFMCEIDQFDVKQGRKWGYTYPDAFLKGMIYLEGGAGWSGEWDNAATWNGKTGIWTYKQICKIMYKTEMFSRIVAPHLSKEDTRFIGGNGFCTKYKVNKQLLNDGRMTFLQSKEKRLFIIDPDQHLYYMINTGMVKGDTINTKSKQTRYYFIDLEEEQRDSKDRACMIYGEGHQFLSFAACIEQEQYNLFSTLGGCQVPWFVPQEKLKQTCEGKVNFTEANYRVFKAMMKKIILSTKSGVAAVYPNCLIPCTTININVKLAKEEAAETTELVLTFKETVKVIKHVQAYGIFDLVVEVGSCLGLWIGLSALGFLDLLLDAFRSLMKMVQGRN